MFNLINISIADYKFFHLSSVNGIGVGICTTDGLKYKIIDDCNLDIQ